MPIDAPRLGPDYLQNQLDNTLTLKLGRDGTASVEVARQNSIPHQFLREIGIAGAPPGWRRRSGSPVEGRHAYSTKVGADRLTLARQTIEQINPEDDTWALNRPVTPGTGPKGAGSPLVAKIREMLPAPEVVKVPVTRVGFPAGPIFTAITCEDGKGNHTLPTETAEGTVTGSGQSLEFTLLPEVPSGTRRQGLWVGLSRQNLRLHRLVPASKKTHTLHAFNPNGRKLPTRNETKIGSPKKPAFGKLRGAGDIERRGGQGHDLMPMTLRVCIVECDNSAAGGDSLPSPPSDTKVVEKDRRKERSNEEIAVTVRLAGAAGDNTLAVQPLAGEIADGKLLEFGAVRVRLRQSAAQGANSLAVEPLTDPLAVGAAATTNATVTRTVEGPHPNEAFLIRPDGMHPRSVGYKVYCQVDEIANPPWYRLIATSKPDRAVHFARGNTVRLYGIKDGDPVEGRLGYVLVQEDPPTEDTTGIEDPSGEIDVPRSFGPSRPVPGTYLLGYSEVRGGRETPVSRLTRATVAGANNVATETLEMRFPPKVNEIPNALFTRLDSAGVPLDWTFTANAGPIAYPGGCGLKTPGQVLDANATPRGETKLIPVDRDRLKPIRGTLKVSEWASGIGRADIVQYSDEAGTAIVASNILASLDKNGSAPFLKKAGPGGDFEWHADALYYRLRWYAIGNPRNLRVDLIKPAVHPRDWVPRVFEERTGSGPWVPSDDPSVPYPSSHVIAISPPPQTAASAASSNPPLDFADHETTTNGGLPAGFAASKSTNDANTEAQVILRGTNRVFRSRKSHKTAHGFAIAAKGYTQSKTLAERFRIWLNAIPTYAKSRAAVASILTSDGTTAMGRIYVRQDNNYLDPKATLLLATYGKNSYENVVPLVTGLRPNDELDVEIILGGGGTTAGNASANVGVGGSSPTPRNSISGVDWTGKFPATVRYGGHAESHSQSTWSFDFDDVAVTRSGYVSSDEQPANVEPIAEPDVPTKAGTVIYSGTGATDQAVTARVSLGIEAALTFSALPTADKVISKIPAPDGSSLAELVVSPNGDLTARRASGGATRKVGTVAAGISLTADIAIEGAGTSAGNLLCWLTIAGKRQLWAALSNLDLSAGLASRGQVLAGTEYTIGAVSITERGSVEYDDSGPDGEPANQGYVSVMPNDVLETDLGYEIEEFFVKPGVERTFAVQIRHQDAPALPPKPFILACYDAKGNEWRPPGYEGGIYGPDGVTTNQSVWTDRTIFYTPPAGFFRARVFNRAMTGGTFVFQKPLSARGRLETQSARDAKRNELYESGGVLKATLRGKVPDQTTVSGGFEEKWVSLSVAHESPTGTTVTPLFRSSSDDVTYSAYDADEFAIPRDVAYADTQVALASSLDGTLTPTIPSGGISLLYETALPHLTRSDRSPLPGGVSVHGLTSPYELPDYRTEPKAGKPNPVPITDDIGRLEEFQVIAFTREAFVELKETLLDEEWFIEWPKIDRVIRVKLYDVAESEEFDGELQRERSEHIYSIFNVGLARVVESAPFYPVGDPVA